MSKHRASQALWAAAAALGAIGLISRLVPLLDVGGRLLRQFSSEDGYLMLTMSRNIALGHGMSIAAGTIPTNGTQPLATYLYAAGFWLVDGDREAGVAVAQGMQLAIAIVAASLIFLLGRRAFARHPLSAELAAQAAALWFAAPLSLRHSMNNLETGLYAACVAGLALAVTAPAPSVSGPAWGRWAGIGALLGLCFWARNDGVLLCGAVGLVHLGAVLPASRGALPRRIAELSVAALATLAVASPWLASNWIRFGSIMPVSGHAQSLGAGFAQNLASAPTKLLEHALLVLPLPSALERQAWVPWLSAILLGAGALALLRGSRSASREVRGLIVFGGIYSVSLVAFYGLFFGAGHFMSRYLFPSSVLLVLAAVGGTAALLRRTPEGLRAATASAAVLAAIGLTAGLDWRLYQLGTRHDHFQVVEWVEKHVDDSVWVGAIQSGTLGFFHDRTLNLDGKVNPAALVARGAGRIPHYVVESPIEYLVDWAGMERWIRKEPIEDHFDLIVNDQQRNLAVLARRGTPRQPASEG